MNSFKTWFENTERVMFLIRGPSGTGKSTLSQTLGGEVFSSDDFFGSDPEEYLQNFSPEKVPEAHNWNLERVGDAMRRSVSPIIVDNTMTQGWEMKPYVTLADKFGYRPVIQEPQSGIWRDIKDMMQRKDQAGLDSAADELVRRNKHGVPKERIKDMFQQWEPVDLDQIRQSRMPWE